MAQATSIKAEWLASGADPAYFVDNFAIIDEPQGESISTLPFRLWYEQVQLLWDLLEVKRIIILKARQLGITWLCCAYALWLCIFHKGKTVLAFSQGQEEADEIIRRVKVMYERLPNAMLVLLPKLIKDNTSELKWGNGSRVKAFPATKKAGRSFTASLVLMDETAWMEWGEQLYTAVKPTVDNGGQLIVFSTANGEDNIFYRIWSEAEKGLNEFKAVFLPWSVHPKRNADWYAKTEREYPSSALMRQEYPATPEEAFTNTGAERFLASMLWWDNCLEALAPLSNREPLVLSADAGVSNDNFALVGVTRHPDPKRYDTDIAVRYVQKWQPERDKPLDFAIVEREIRGLCLAYNVICFTYDPYQMHDMATRLQNDGVVWVVPFPQGTDRLESDKQLLDLITSKRLAHDGNADLREHIDNADKQVDAQSRKLRIVKRTASKKVDACVALSMSAYKCLELPL